MRKLKTSRSEYLFGSLIFSKIDRSKFSLCPPPLQVYASVVPVMQNSLTVHEVYSVNDSENKDESKLSLGRVNTWGLNIQTNIQ